MGFLEHVWKIRRTDGAWYAGGKVFFQSTDGVYIFVNAMLFQHRETALVQAQALKEEGYAVRITRKAS